MSFLLESKELPHASSQSATISSLDTPLTTLPSEFTNKLDTVLQTCRRPLLVRFRGYVEGGGPVHIGYGGDTGRAVLEPYGFKETESDDWVRYQTATVLEFKI